MPQNNIRRRRGGRGVENGNVANNRNRLRPPSAPRISRFSLKCLFTSSIIAVFATLGFVIFANVYDDIQNSLKYINHDMRTTNLTECVEISNDLIQLDKKITRFLVDDPLSNLLMLKLQPIQDRVTSLTTQTHEYEAMDQVARVPTRFITSSLEELDNMEEIVIALDDEVDQIVLNGIAEAQLIMSSIKNLAEAVDFMEDVLLKCFFTVDDVRMRTSKVKKPHKLSYEDLTLVHSFEEVVKFYTDIIPMMTKFFDTSFQIEALSKEMGIIKERKDWEMVTPLNFTDPMHRKLNILRDEHEAYSKRIKEIFEENYIMAQLLIPHYSATCSRLGELNMQLFDYVIQIDEKRKGYLNITEILEDDIQDLRIRIQTLRFL